MITLGTNAGFMLPVHFTLASAGIRLGAIWEVVILSGAKDLAWH
jgi:hypothetical protein